jgi:hypothetical protein
VSAICAAHGIIRDIIIIIIIIIASNPAIMRKTLGYVNQEVKNRDLHDSVLQGNRHAIR